MQSDLILSFMLGREIEMKSYIVISERSRELVKKFLELKPNETLENWHVSDSFLISTDELVHWLNQEIETNPYSRYHLEELRLSFLQDLQEAFLTTEELEKQNKKKSTPWYRNSQFIILTIAGIVLAFCDGFNGITSILALFNPVPMTIFTIGVAFALISVAVFHGLDLVEISRNVGVKPNASKALLNTLVKQVELIKEIRNKIDHIYIETEDREELQNYHRIIKMLIQRFNAMEDERNSYLQAMDNPLLKMAKLSAALITGVLFFSSGFFAGQSLALPIAALFVASASATFLPVLLASLAIGIAAFCVYWYSVRPGVENIVGRLVGLDKEEVDNLADPEKVEFQVQALKQLEKKLGKYLHSKDSIDQLTTEVNDLAELNEEILTQAAAVAVTQAHNRYAHFNSTSSLHEIEPIEDEIENRLN
jgi:VIT1/CCC1 family predicted Fe2+/Mn2+ transporter